MRRIFGAQIVLSALVLAPIAAYSDSLEDVLVNKGIITKEEAAKSASAGTPTRVYYDDGSRFEFPDTGFSAKVNTLIQSRYSFIDPEDSNKSSFDVHRAQLTLSGVALNEEFNYKVESDFIGNLDQGEVTQSPALLDGYLQWNACDWLHLRAGQFKTGISRQFNTYAQALQFPDRTEASNFMSLGRQAGASATLDFPNNKGSWGLAISNGGSDGEGINRSGNDTKHLGVFNIRYNFMGQMDPFIEGDIDWTENPALNIGTAFAYGENSNDLGNGAEDTQTYASSTDINFKLRGFSVHSEIFYDKFRPTGTGAKGLRTGDGTHYHGTGGYIQSGYFLCPQEWEVAARYGILDCDSGAAGDVCSGNDYVHQASAGLNYFWWENHLKAQLAYEHIDQDVVGDGDAQKTNKWILQLAGYF